MAMRQQFSDFGADVMGRALTSGRKKEANTETIEAMINNLLSHFERTNRYQVVPDLMAPIRANEITRK